MMSNLKGESIHLSEEGGYFPSVSDKQPTLDSRLSLFALMHAADRCKRGTGWKTSVQAFLNYRSSRCLKLYIELKEGRYYPGPTFQFVINDRGKTRHINAIGIDDRVVQRWFCDWVLAPVIAARITEDNSACLKGRGLAYAIERVRDMAAATPREGWVLQFDFHDYFASINQNALLSIMSQFIRDDDLFAIYERIVRANKVGLELGSHVSQLSAVFFPNEMDHIFAALDMAIGYHRYMDDGVVFFPSKQAAAAGLELLRTLVEAMGLTLNAKKTHINRITHPFVFCKKRFEWSEDGVSVYVRKEQTRHVRKRGASMLHSHHDINLAPVKSSYLGCVNSGDEDLSFLIEMAFGKESIDGDAMGSREPYQLALPLSLGGDDG